MVMKAKRKFHKNTINEYHRKVKERTEKATKEEQVFTEIFLLILV